jgi:hypothetical protein
MKLEPQLFQILHFSKNILIFQVNSSSQMVEKLSSGLLTSTANLQIVVNATQSIKCLSSIWASTVYSFFQ